MALFVFRFLFIVFGILVGGGQTDSSTETIETVKFTTLCGRNISLTRPDQLFRIDFNVLVETFDHRSSLLQNCSTFIRWSGQDGIDLIPNGFEPSSTIVASKTDFDPKRIMLSVHETNGTMFELKMYGPLDFYLTIIPVARPGERCRLPDYAPCNENYCIHRNLMCSGSVYCYGYFQKIFCSQSPSTFFLLSSIFGLLLTSVVFSMLCFLFIYFRINHNQASAAKLLDPKFQPKLYGTVNDGEREWTILDANRETPAQEEQQQQRENSKFKFYQNIQHYTENHNPSKKCELD